MVLRIGSRLLCTGRLSLTLHDAQTGAVVGYRAADNLIVDSGIALLAQALNYSLILAEDVAWGSPYAPPVGALYAAVGTSADLVAAGQTALGAEIGRALVTNASVSGPDLSYDFFAPTAIGNGAITELGTFGAASFLAPVLSVALAFGTTYTSLAVSGVVGAIPSGATLTVGYGTATTQAVTTTAPVSVGDTSIAVTSFIAGANFGAATLVAYTPGTLIDRVVLGSPITKTAAQTMTVNLSMTLASG